MSQTFRTRTLSLAWEEFLKIGSNNCNSPTRSHEEAARLLSPWCEVSIEVDLFMMYSTNWRKKQDHMKLKISDDSES